MRKYIFILLPCLCFAQMPEYYEPVDFELAGNALKVQLAALITDTHENELDYTPEVWNALKQADLDPANPENVLLIYGYDDADASNDNDRTRDKDLSCHTSSCEGLWVREHVYPRSLGDPNLEFEGPGADAHSLRAIDNSMNGARSNRPFADGSGHSTTLTGGNFYPGDEWKGDVARMMMYMYVRYGSQCLATEVGVGSTSYSTLGDMPDIFLEWNAEDPVSQYERNRNAVLENMQGNRNPFIDNPYIATMIWNGPNAEDTWGTLAISGAQLAGMYAYPTVTTGAVTLVNAANNYSCTAYNSLGQQVPMAINGNIADLQGNAPGIYILNVKHGASHKSFRVVLQ
ncbi:endonuclease [uncultured Flavobacterium sp.]|uniref:endonuclease n=1 Tax=uncultured Flavobacterium sp. TaxID=165435 RepID=UPI0025F076FA|nr:endonuclease [uncultured Flavobacterium sp.]